MALTRKQSFAPLPHEASLANYQERMTGSIPILISSGVMRQLAESLRGRPKLVDVSIEEVHMKQIDDMVLKKQ